MLPGAVAFFCLQLLRLLGREQPDAHTRGWIFSRMQPNPGFNARVGRMQLPVAAHARDFHGFVIYLVGIRSRAWVSLPAIFSPPLFLLLLLLHLLLLLLLLQARLWKVLVIE
uniref:Secreted protein n=1 Tax=Eutreptiella gymnastica TaxID=73025 RepID=A0A7S4FZD2_9EUGL